MLVYISISIFFGLVSDFSVGNAAPRVIDHSPISTQNSPMANTEDSQNSDK